MLYSTPPQVVLSYLFYPLSVIMGVVPEDCLQVGRLIGLKTFLNEFVAYVDLSVLTTNRVGGSVLSGT